MNAKTVTEHFVSAYVKLLDNLHCDAEVLDAVKVNILCSQYNKNLQLNSQNENESTNTDNHCPQCLTPWKNGSFTMKTIPKCKNSKLQKKSPKFVLVIKCLVCLRVTSSVFEKNKELNKKSTKKISKHTEKIVEIPKIEEEKVNIIIKKPKKKKRNLYAGLNPLVFKNRDLCKKNKIKPATR